MAEADLERDLRATIRAAALLRLRRRAIRRRARSTRPASAWCRATAASSTSIDRTRPTLPAWLDRGRHRLLRRRVRAHRLPRRAELVPQHRPQLGAAGAVAGRAGDACPRSTWRASATWCCHFRGMDQLLPTLHDVRPESAQDDHPARLRPLDPAGAPGRGQRGDAGVPEESRLASPARRRAPSSRTRRRGRGGPARWPCRPRCAAARR